MMVIPVKKEKKKNKPRTFCPPQHKVGTSFRKIDFGKLGREINGKSSSCGSGYGALAGI